MISKLFSLILILLPLTACDSIEIEQNRLPRPNIVWITSEDNSKHYLKLFDANGVASPNIEKLAKQGLVFTHAFSNGPVCSVARSAIISGCYGPRIGAQFHRRYMAVPMPASLKMFPFYLREAGYYTTNNRKKDYNIIESDSIWDESSNQANWKNKEENQPFFHVFNIGLTHESSLHFTTEFMDTTETKTDPESFNIHPNHPDTKLFRFTNALYRDRIREMDRKVGEVIDELVKEDLLDNTFIFYFGDHGGVLPGSKGYLYETGLHVPLVVHVPENFRHLVGDIDSREVGGFVSFIDLAPTVLNIAGVRIPAEMDGDAFLGTGVDLSSVSNRNKTFSYADRFDEKYDLVRSVRKGRYKYIRNFQPHIYDGLMNNYRYKQLAYQEWKDLHENGELNDIQSAFFEFKDPEYLFDLESDPFETINLAGESDFSSVLMAMRTELNSWIKGMPDLSFYPEQILIDSAFSNPTGFGKRHKKEISKYLDVVNLSLSEFTSIENQITKSLNSTDAWERYWALTAAISFGEDAKELIPLLSRISKDDSELTNRVRASEFLAIVSKINPTESMTNCLYSSNKPAEALLILNSIVLMESYSFGYDFEIELGKIDDNVKDDVQVKRRLEYLKVI
ncbi:MAG TPA: sulfatase [Flavobacteriales bacterium]|nr:sulfatase [Flavobacteriales bacterium]